MSIKRRNSRIQGASLLALLLLVACKPVPSATGEKVLHTALPAHFKGFDPALAEDAYTNQIVHELYETLYQYAYRKRPIELEPCLAQSMPVISQDQLTYTITIKQGVFFSDDPAFAPGGSGRELTADDMVYSIKRLADPRTNSTGWWLFDNKIVGLNAFRQAMNNQRTNDYGLEVAGLRALDRYTLQIRLTKPYPQLLYALSMPYSSAVAREAVEFYGQEFINHPVGTGPFVLEKYRRDYEVVLKRNPRYRQESVHIPESKAVVRLPQLDKVVVRIQRESQPRWLNFLQGNLDWCDIPKDNFDSAIDAKGQLKPELIQRGMELWKGADIDLTYTAFNMDDPIIGNNVHLRRAMSLAFDTNKRIERLYNGRAVPAHSPIPPGLTGHDENLKNPYKVFNLVQARQEMIKAGYPGGKGLPVLRMQSIADTSQRHFDELFVAEMAAIGITIQVETNTWPELLDKINKRQAAIFGMAWGADYPDAENFLSLFYSANASPGNNSTNYRNKAFDQLYEKAKQMQDSPERTKLYQQMAQIVNADVPMIYGVHRIRVVPYYRWLKNFVPHPMRHGFFKYYDIDNALKASILTAS